MITVYVKRFNKETDEEPHIESYEIEEYPGRQMRNLILNLMKLKNILE